MPSVKAIILTLLSVIAHTAICATIITHNPHTISSSSHSVNLRSHQSSYNSTPNSNNTTGHPPYCRCPACCEARGGLPGNATTSLNNSTTTGGLMNYTTERYAPPEWSTYFSDPSFNAASGNAGVFNTERLTTSALLAVTWLWFLTC